MPCPYDHRISGVNEVKIGILAVQGDFAAHAAMLAGLGVETVEVRAVKELDGCDGLISARRGEHHTASIPAGRRFV